MYRILCLTRSKDQEYMWNNYAGDKTGFCIEYERENLKSISSIMREMTYESKKIPNSYFEDSLDRNKFEREIDNVLFKKGIGYKKENETRIINRVYNDMIIEVGRKEYLDQKWNANSLNEYFEEFFTKKYFKAPKRIMEKCIPHKIYLGPNILKNDEEQIRAIIQGRQYNVEKLEPNELRTI